MIPNPILKVLSTLSIHHVRYLLMGGQACVFYGAAEFSRDCDIAILCEPENLSRLQSALHDLRAVPIAVPPFESQYLLRGHAVHFRCQATEAENIRLDVMAKMRGVAPFGELWARRTTITDDTGAVIELMSLLDLVAAKKTQRDKDWPMLRRLVEAHFVAHLSQPTRDDIYFWLTASRTSEMLLRLAAAHPQSTRELAQQRPLLVHAIQNDQHALDRALAEEQEAERAADEQYWKPLKAELEQLRARLR